MDLDLNSLSLGNDSQETFEKILDALSKGDTNIIGKILEKGYVIQETDSDGNTLLHLAAMKNPGTKMILKKKISIDARIILNKKIIPSAKRCYIAKMLIQNGANVNSKDKKGFTPLHIAVKENQIDLAKIFLDHGADIEAKSNFVQTPLDLAVNANLIDMASLLLQNGANVNTGNSWNETPLYKAIDYRLVKMTKLLTYFGADVDVQRNFFDYTPLLIAFYAITRYNEEIVETLIRYSTKKSIEIALRGKKLDMMKAILLEHMF